MQTSFVLLVRSRIVENDFCQTINQARKTLKHELKLVNNGMFSRALVGFCWTSLHEKGSQSLYTGQQPGTKSAFRPADETCDKLQVNGWFCYLAGLHRNSFVLACTKMRRGIPRMQRRRCTSLHPVCIQEWGALFVLLVNDCYMVKIGARKITQGKLSSRAPPTSAKECLTPNGSSATNGYVKLDILFTKDFALSCFWKDAQTTFLRSLGG